MVSLGRMGRERKDSLGLLLLRDLEDRRVLAHLEPDGEHARHRLVDVLGPEFERLRERLASAIAADETPAGVMLGESSNVRR